MDNDTYEVNQRLEGIFRPSAKKRRDEIKSKKGRFVHYTSAENAMNIILTKSVWMRNTKCMNDYMEVLHGYNLLIKYFESNEKKFFDALKPFGNELGPKSIAIFKQWSRVLEFHAYITSISEHDDQFEDKYGRLSMWRAYGTPSSKAALVLNIPFDPEYKTDALNLFLSPVEYSSYKDVEREMNQVIENINSEKDFLLLLDSQSISNWIFITLITTILSIKHECFREEKEWRIFYLPTLYQSSLISLQIKTINGVPQIICAIPLINKDQVTGMSIPEVINRIIIGPSQYPAPMSHAFSTALSLAGVNNANDRVTESNIPLRT